MKKLTSREIDHHTDVVLGELRERMRLHDDPFFAKIVRNTESLQEMVDRFKSFRPSGWDFTPYDKHLIAIRSLLDDVIRARKDKDRRRFQDTEDGIRSLNTFWSNIMHPRNMPPMNGWT